MKVSYVIYLWAGATYCYTICHNLFSAKRLQLLIELHADNLKLRLGPVLRRVWKQDLDTSLLGFQAHLNRSRHSLVVFLGVLPFGEWKKNDEHIF